ncbi:MAG: glycosyltransferase [Caldilineaceae bacterium]
MSEPLSGAAATLAAPVVVPTPASSPTRTPAPLVDVTVVLPTYNEKMNICDLVDALCVQLGALDISYEVLVVDDNSPDGTANAVRARYGLDALETAALATSQGARAGRGIVRLHVRTANKGLAKSIRDGLEMAWGRTLVVMDTDFNHDPAMVPQMVDLLRYYDLVIGSRFVMRGGMEEVWRYRASLLYNYFIRFLFQTQIQDHLSGFFAVRRERLQTLAPMFDRIFFGYGDYFIRLLLVAWRDNWKILEVPVFYILRRHGSSKSGFVKILRDYTSAVVRLRLRGV